MPLRLVEFYIELNVGALVKTRHAHGAALIVFTRIGKRCTGDLRQSVCNEWSRLAFRSETRMVANGVKIHGRKLCCRAAFRECHSLGGVQGLVKIETCFF